MREKTVMRAYFEGLFHDGAKESLENTFLPFYCIGGAGTHYPVMDDQGNPLYPSEMRLPRRILGLLPIPETDSNLQSAQDDYQQYFETFGFGGQWFDCRDVEGFLKERKLSIIQTFTSFV
ncbi:hypothetical protein EMCG_04198 [[Emmonsia] crescens]|uniref:Uncharacterized protein n=1 Tax=[Emmonsia] crescens TaxID=73230 RepID=A0A0G2HTX2_9EURO|nr:hypothetical protein EMCG_04198 [Emmonsia crescens UAMH 3008]